MGWFASIIVRELNTFEIAERHRLSIIIAGGFILTHPAIEIVEKKVEMILLGTIAQSLRQLSDYEWLPSSKRQNIEKDTERLRTTYMYFVEIFIPMVLKIEIVHNEPLSFSTVMMKYRELGRTLQKVEKLVVPPYNSQPDIDAKVEWNYHLNRYALER